MSPTVGSAPCPRIASRNWCWAGVSPAALACSSDHRMNRRNPSRNRRSSVKSACDNRLSGFISCHDTYVMLSRALSRVPHLRLGLLAGLLGLAAGGAAWVLLHLVGLFTSLFLFHQWGWTPPSFAELHPSPWIVVAAVAGAAVVTLMAKSAPLISAHATPEGGERVGDR